MFCVYTKTAETIRDQLDAAIDEYLGEIREGIFGDASAFENFRRRFFNRREQLYSLIQDQPLLGEVREGRVVVRQQVALTVEHLRQVAALLVAQGEYAESDKPDRRLIIAATEQVAVKWWREFSEGEEWLGEVLRSCRGIEDRMVEPSWLKAREPLSRSARAGRVSDVRRTPKRESKRAIHSTLKNLRGILTQVQARSRLKMRSIRGCDGFARTQLERSWPHTSGMD